MKFKLLLKCFTSAALAAAVMFPATSSATISGSKPLVQYSKLKAVFNEGAASAAHSLEIGKAETIYAYDVARSKLQGMEYEILPAKIPRNIFEIDFDDNEFNQIQALLFYAEDFIKIQHSLLDLTNRMFEAGSPLKLYSDMFFSFKYMDENGDAFIKIMQETDLGIEKCLKYTDTMVSQMRQGKIPQPMDALSYDGSLLYQNSPQFNYAFNSVSVMDSHLRGFDSSDYDSLETNGENIRTEAGLINDRLEKLYKDITKSKYEQLSGYEALYKAFSGYLKNINTLCDSIQSLWKSRSDTGTTHGKIFTGNIDLKYKHFEPTVTKKRAIYRSQWIKGYAKCVSAFNNARTECRKEDKIKGTEINLMK